MNLPFLAVLALAFCCVGQASDIYLRELDADFATVLTQLPRGQSIDVPQSDGLKLNTICGFFPDSVTKTVFPPPTLHFGRRIQLPHRVEFSSGDQKKKEIMLSIRESKLVDFVGSYVVPPAPEVKVFNLAGKLENLRTGILPITAQLSQAKYVTFFQELPRDEQSQIPSEFREYLAPILGFRPSTVKKLKTFSSATRPSLMDFTGERGERKKMIFKVDNREGVFEESLVAFLVSRFLHYAFVEEHSNEFFNSGDARKEFVRACQGQNYKITPWTKDAVFIDFIQSQALGGLKRRNYAEGDNKELGVIAHLNLRNQVVRRNFRQSTAIFMALSYIFGLGDGHADNMMVTNDGKFVRIDYGWCFGKHPFLDVPTGHMPSPVYKALELRVMRDKLDWVHFEKTVAQLVKFGVENCSEKWSEDIRIFYREFYGTLEVQGAQKYIDFLQSQSLDDWNRKRHRAKKTPVAWKDTWHWWRHSDEIPKKLPILVQTDLHEHKMVLQSKVSESWKCKNERCASGSNRHAPSFAPRKYVCSQSLRSKNCRDFVLCPACISVPRDEISPDLYHEQSEEHKMEEIEEVEEEGGEEEQVLIREDRAFCMVLGQLYHRVSAVDSRHDVGPVMRSRGQLLLKLSGKISKKNRTVNVKSSGFSWTDLGECVAKTLDGGVSVNVEKTGSYNLKVGPFHETTIVLCENYGSDWAVPQVEFSDTHKTITIEDLHHTGPEMWRLINYITGASKGNWKKSWFSNFLGFEQPKFHETKAFGITAKDGRIIVFFRSGGAESFKTLRGDKNGAHVAADQDVMGKNFTTELGRIGLDRCALSSVQKLSESLVTKLNDFIRTSKLENAEILFTGHSFAGAVANIAAAMTLTSFRERFHINLRIGLVTFGSPRPGNRQFSQWCNHNFDYAFRYINQDDTVPRTPSKFYDMNAKSVGLTLVSKDSGKYTFVWNSIWWQGLRFPSTMKFMMFRDFYHNTYFGTSSVDMMDSFR